MKIIKYIILFFTIIFSGFTYTHSPEINKMGTNPMIWVSEWVPSDNLSSDYGRGRFFYRFARSKYPVDRYGNYKHEISFISDSFYPYYMYSDLNGEDVNRCSTKIDNMTLYVNGKKYINTLTGTTDFWILFKGNFEKGIGEVRVQLLYPSINPSILIQWSDPKPF